MTDLFFARAQMAVSLGFHIVFAAVGIGMPSLMALAEGRWLRAHDPVFLELAKRWAGGTAVLFAVGAVYGTVLSFELGLRARRFRWARLAAVGQVVCMLLGWGFAQFPYIVIPDVTLANSAAEPAKLSILVWALLAGAVLLFPSFGYLFYIFKGGRR